MAWADSWGQSHQFHVNSHSLSFIQFLSPAFLSKCPIFYSLPDIHCPHSCICTTLMIKCNSTAPSSQVHTTGTSHTLIYIDAYSPPPTPHPEVVPGTHTKHNIRPNCFGVLHYYVHEVLY